MPSHSVTIEEMKAMSIFGSKVPEPVMLRLEQLSQEGCNLATMLDDRAWSALAALSESFRSSLSPLTKAKLPNSLLSS
jgi:hypothetical protein